ncbi:MAG: glycosyltransferase, partial [Nocardioidaceae bacterium]
MSTVHVVVATAEWDHDRLRYRRHRLAEFLRDQPDTEQVIWLCPGAGGTRTLVGGIEQWSVKDLLPPKAFRFARYVDVFHRRKLAPLVRRLRGLQGPVQGSVRLVVWFTFPGFPVLLDLPMWDRVVYDCSDLWSAPLSGEQSVVTRARRRVIARAEARVVQRADVIVCTSSHLHEEVVRAVGRERAVHTLENGVEYDVFAADHPAPDGVLPDGFDGTVLGFVGGLKPKLDFALLAEVMTRRSDWLLLLVGPDGTGGRPDLQRLLGLPNVVWPGAVPAGAVPGYLSLVDVGVMPYLSSPYNDAVFPLKLFEFLAAGKPVVGTNLPSTASYAEPNVYSHLLAAGADEVVAACESVVDADAGFVGRRREVARTRDWADVFREM